MLTPQEIEQISFSRATFGGYDMESVDTFLEPLIDDFTTLYKENALLKSKMKALVSKLEEYRANEASMKDAIINAQKTCDLMVQEAEAKCTQMLVEANAAAIENAKNADAMIAAEDARVEEARQAACTKIDDLKEQLLSIVTALDQIKASNPPAPSATGAFDYDQVESGKSKSDTMADEISATLQNLIGTTEDVLPVVETHHPVADTTADKFKDLQFGPNYDPTKR